MSLRASMFITLGLIQITNLPEMQLFRFIAIGLLIPEHVSLRA